MVKWSMRAELAIRAETILLSNGSVWLLRGEMELAPPLCLLSRSTSLWLPGTHRHPLLLLNSPSPSPSLAPSKVGGESVAKGLAHPELALLAASWPHFSPCRSSPTSQTHMAFGALFPRVRS